MTASRSWLIKTGLISGASLGLWLYALFFIRAAILPTIRPYDSAVLVVLSLAFALALVWLIKRAPNFLARGMAVSGLVFLALALGTTIVRELGFQYRKTVVLKTDPEILHRLGRHFVVGYTNFNALRTLVVKKAIAGVYVGSRNVVSFDGATLKDSLADLQALRRSQGLPPLLIGTDQEGGVVARLSPPLPLLPPLADMALAKDLDRSVVDYARQQANGLTGLGINLNFAPVIDVDHGIKNPNDRYSQISRRSISPNPAVIEKVATEYAKSLSANGVLATLKHYPGLGSVYEDTHRANAVISQRFFEHDHSLFFEIAERTDAFIMVSHAKVEQLEERFTASTSPTLIGDKIRGEMKFSGVLITDDFSMFPIAKSDGGVGGASLRALNSGIDLILCSFDPDLYYDAMYDLLQRIGELDPAALALSAHRLDQVSNRLLQQYNSHRRW